MYLEKNKIKNVWYVEKFYLVFVYYYFFWAWVSESDLYTDYFLFFPLTILLLSISNSLIYG